MGEEISMNYVMGRLREKERDLGAEDWMNYVVEKLKEWLVVLENFGASLIGKVDEVFPPETREEQLRHWLRVATPFIIGAVALLLFIWFCRCCCRCCCGGGRRVEMKMMIAPGRGGLIPRPGFEANPRSYFRGLRGKPLDELL